METVTVSREFGAPVDHVRSVFDDPPAFFDAVGFDVEGDTDRLELTKQVAMMEIELDIRLCSDTVADLAYEQIEGPFETMMTAYHVGSMSAGSRITIETSFDPPTSGFGSFLNKAAIKRQRQAELETVDTLLESVDSSSVTTSWTPYS